MFQPATVYCDKQGFCRDEGVARRNEPVVVTPQPRGPVDNPSTPLEYSWASNYLMSTLVNPIHKDSFLYIFLVNIQLLILLYKSLIYNSFTNQNISK